MKRFLKKFFGIMAKSVAGKKKPGYRPHFEGLESRWVPATLGVTNIAVLDFDGEWLDDAQLNAGRWDIDDFLTTEMENGKEWVHTSSFSQVFNNNNAYLDMNGDGNVNGLDADLAIGKIVEKVTQDFAPYDLNIVVGDQDDYQDRLSDDIDGDVIVLISGGEDVYQGTSRGWGPVDAGNDSDELAFVFGGVIADGYSDADRFVNAVARTISHEMGHTFGLEHVVFDPSGVPDLIRHEMMSTTDRDFTRDFVFQDQFYQTVDGLLQNSHQHLSQPDILGPSAYAWMAVLKPGELTISGNSGRNTITVDEINPSTWDVLLVGSHRTVELNSSGVDSLNPFAQPLSQVKIFGLDGNDTINADITGQVYAYGGNGNDHISGSSNGNDYLYGGEGNDTLYGLGGSDQLYGEGGDDDLDGGAGGDNLFGGSGNDYLSGGQDGNADFLNGGTGADEFQAEYYWWWGQKKNRDFPTDYKPLEGDVIVA